MAYKITIGDKSILLDDFTAVELANVGTKADPPRSWLAVLNAPAFDPEAFYALVCEAAKKLEVPSPDRPANARETLNLVLATIGDAPDDLPTGFAEGGIPLGEAGETETTTSSTSIAPEDGNPSELGTPASAT